MKSFASKLPPYIPNTRNNKIMAAYNTNLMIKTCLPKNSPKLKK